MIFKLDFISGGEGLKNIDEPIGFSDVDFNLKQDIYSRHNEFSGGESQFTFSRMRNHEIEILLFYYQYYKFEAVVNLIIEIDGEDDIIGALNFASAETDGENYFKCTVIEENNRQNLKRRQDVKIDILSDEDLDGNAVTPVTIENVLLKAKPVYQVSEWEIPTEYSGSISNSTLGGGGETRYFTPFYSLKRFDIDDSFIAFFQKQINYKNLELIKAKNNLKEIKVSIKNMNVQLSCDSDGGASGNVPYSLVLEWGDEQRHSFLSGNLNPGQSTTITSDFEFTIPAVTRDTSIYLYFKINARKTSNLGTIEAFINAVSMDVKISAISFAYNTITGSIRLIDAVRQTVKNASGLPVSFPLAEPNGEYYNDRLFNGNLLRNIRNKGFFLSMKSIKEGVLTEINGDYEVNDEVFFGIYRDFYQPIEVAKLDAQQFSEYTETINERYALNEFKAGYKKYLSQKETEKDNTSDIIHGQSEWLLANKSVENTKEWLSDWVRCAFSIEDQRRKAFDISDETATQEDDTIYIIKTKPNTADLTFTEFAELLHTYEDNVLTINNDGSFSFELLGITPETTLTINSPDLNAGSYSVARVTGRSLVLNPAGSVSAANNGNRLTSFTYVVLASTISGGVIVGDEDFDFISAMILTENFSNLDRSVKRNIIKYYSPYLATANVNGKAIKNTFYKNNSKATISKDGFTTTEGDSFTPDGAILGAKKYNMTFVVPFSEFRSLQKKMRSVRGYIATRDSRGLPLKVYPQQMKYTIRREELEVIAEERYNVAKVRIITENSETIYVNDDYILQNVTFVTKGNEITLYDGIGKQLYPAVFWNEISVNGEKPENLTQIQEWLIPLS